MYATDFTPTYSLHRKAVHFSVVCALSLVAACGGARSASDDDVQTSQDPEFALSATEDPLLTNPPAEILATVTSKSHAATWRELLRSPNYSGRIVVRFAEDSNVALDTSRAPQPFVSRAGKSVTRVNGIRQALPRVHVRRLFADIDDQRLRTFRAEQRRRGVRLHDWTSVYVFETKDPVEAELVLMALYADENVVWAHPEPVGVLNNWPEDEGSSAKTVSVPAITPGQDYVLDQPGSLNVVAAWDQGLTGAGQRVFDIEGNWNYSHEDLLFNEATTPMSGVPADEDFASDQNAINHGTAMAGIMVGKDNAVGVIGIAPNANFRTAPMSPGSLSGAIGVLKDAISDIFAAKIFGAIDTYTIQPGGDVIVIPAGIAATSGKYCWEQLADGTWKNNQCAVAEKLTFNFELIQDLTNLGVVVIEGAGNSGLDLDTAEIIKNCGAECTDLATQDSGAIVVGASLGPDLAKLPLSNCGTRLNLFAWGDGVVTTGYGDHPLSVQDNPNQWYTADFSGTSSATAIISGIVLLLQEYVDQLYGPTLQPWEYAYLNAAQIRELLTHPEVGVSQSDGGCNIGKQPNVGKALELLKNGVINPTIGVKVGGACANSGQGTEACPNPATLAKALDLNADGRADLVAWGRNGTWYVDLSAGETEGYGAWDLQLTPPPLDEGRLFPVVQDYNTDGAADLALYNTDTGKWYIKYTTDALFAGDFGDWDTVIDYSTQPEWLAGSWPAPGDYDGGDAYYDLESGTQYYGTVLFQQADGTYLKGPSIDIALVRPDGRWLVDLNVGIEEAFGDFDKDLKFLTDAQMAADPGWAYLPSPLHGVYDAVTLAFKSPDGVPNGGHLCELGSIDVAGESWAFYEYPGDLGGNATMPVPESIQSNVGLRYQQQWQVALIDGGDFSVTQPPLAVGEDFGGVECRPVTADFDGDAHDDRAVLCPNGLWKIAYSSTKFINDTSLLQKIHNKKPFQAVPGQIYPGGVDYQEIRDIYGAYNYGCPKTQTCSIHNLLAPIGPYFAECVKLWANHPLSCLKY